MPQPEAGVTYAGKLSKEDAPLDWSRPAAELDCRVRALNPWPGTTARCGAEVLRVLEAEPAEGSGAPGEVLPSRGLLVACGRGALRVARLQRAGGKPLGAEAFLRGFPIPPGAVLG